MATQNSIRHRLLIFSIVLFLLILVGGSMAFLVSMRQIIRDSKANELRQMVDIERVKLEASVNGEIAIALKMADSPLLIRHFLNPGDSELKRIAFDEIEGYRKAFKSNMVFWASDIDKEFYFAEDNHYTIDAENPDNYWYKMTLYETEKFNFNINYNPEIKKTMLWINAPVFDSRHRPVGLVGTGIDLTEFVSSIYRGNAAGRALYFFNTTGEITGAQNTNLIENKTSISAELGGTGAEIFARISSLRNGEILSFTMPEGAVAVGEVPALQWYITALIPITLKDFLATTMTVIFMAMMAVIFVIFIIFYFFISRLLKPLNIMVKTLDKISADWDLTLRLDIQQKDETGTLAKFFNMTFERIGGLLNEIKRKAIALSNTSKELGSTMGETSRAIEKIDGSIQAMRGMVLTQADEVNSSTKSLEQIISGLDSLNRDIDIQVSAVSQSSSAIEQMLANISSVTQTLVKNSANINSLADSSKAGRVDLQKVSEDIQEIARESEGLLEINSVMQNIASQTNLLSMNAAIEAAHAGESGKGFAVVADEIRKLAENSSAQSKTISAVLKKIKSSIDAITKSTAIVLERFGAIENEVDVVSNQEAQIRNAMEEQEVGSRHILDAVTRLNTVTGEVQSSSSNMSIASREVHSQSANLKNISGQVAEGVDSVAESAEMITGAVARVREIGRENIQSIDELNSEVARFKAS